MRAAIIAALMVLNPDSDSRETWTSARVRSTPPDEMTRQLFGGLSGFLLPDTELNALHSEFGRLQQLSFYSLPRAGLVTGLCETDWVRVTFAPVDPSDGSDADVPMRPERIEASTVYFIGNPDRAVRGGIRTVDEQRAFDAACSARDPRQQTRVIAHNPYDFIVGLRLMIALTEAARAGRVPATLDCAGLARSGEQAPAPAQCLAELAAIRPDRIVHTAPPEETPAEVIRHIDTSERWVRLTFGAGETLPSDDYLAGSDAAIPLRVEIGRWPDPPMTF